MPSTAIDYSDAHKALNLQPQILPDGSCFVLTPFGLSLLEIQGELNLPLSAPVSHEGMDPDYLKNFAKVDGIYDAVRFGKMEFDEKDSSKVVLFIGSSQRLLGTVEPLRNPLGVLRVPAENSGENMKIVDVIEKKILFQQRPLPIM
ncbi:hypothetical protein METBIDRAFT_76483 [Metschnikowia bicuspidata var. bicuspidata NRRL YB-4993]|uniref:Ctf8-domain-containing protein n=1 Tax=Metschnikowia bicuspidata var. bicuspidata NRRL YB-4993 TaxID=869754 RepID=A0A1A0HHZ8_9ASCO|nr:hypothetical protein METBIDRAFT_76483 [Metschnikowia bicuspidata var. bicuspidata NRRL YB-4993]OBA23468.1 hypothetical protein METBIDRAFT_76483 [Metschnikowia bicuspidata var. bicuspidata NRRL YB-4993]